MDVVDLVIRASVMQFIKEEHARNETAVGEAGRMTFGEDGIQPDTVNGDGSSWQVGLFGGDDT